MDLTRLLINPKAPDKQTYKIVAVTRGRALTLATFQTGGVNGRTADETAEGNVMDASETEGKLELYKLTVKDGRFVDVLMMTAEYGIGQPCRMNDQIEA